MTWYDMAAALREMRKEVDADFSPIGGWLWWSLVALQDGSEDAKRIARAYRDSYFASVEEGVAA